MRRAITALYLLLWSSLLFAGNVPIWETDTGHNRIILLGSIHYLRPSDYPLPAAFDQAMADADIVLMEIDMDDLDPMATMMAMETLGRDAAGQTLQDFIGASRYREVKSRAGSLGIPMMLLDDKKPWYAAMLISQMRLGQMGFDSSWGIESRYLAEARATGKSIAGLETLSEQLGALDSMSVDAQTAFLMETLNDAAEAQSEMNEILSAWKTGDDATMETALLEGMGAIPELYENVVVRRNRNWVKKLESLDYRNDGKTILVIVGGMHLVGEDSVQRLSGWNFKQLSSE